MFKKVARGYLKIVEAICVVLLLVILGCMCIQIVCRLLTIGQNFTEELARLSFSVLIFVGAPLAFTEGADIAVDMVVNVLPKPVRKLIDILINALTAVFSVFCIRSLVTFIGSNVGVTAVSMTWIKMNWLYYIFMASFGFMFIIAVVKIIAILLGKNQIMDINAEQKAKRAEEEVDIGI